MRVKIEQSKPIGIVKAPPSKSMAHRLLICAGLASGKSRITGIAPSQDVLATIDCLRAIGAQCHYEGDVVEIEGVDARRMQINDTLPCRECGSTLRFFIPIALLSSDTARFTGSERLMERPLGVYEQICRERGLRYEREGNTLSVQGRLPSGVYEVAGNISSQFISGLLFALPLLEGDSEIHLMGGVESRAYIDLTLSAMSQFGVTAEWSAKDVLFVKGGQRYCPREAVVEGEYSNAAFLEALNLVGGDVRVEGLSPESLQGDRVYLRYFRELAEGFAALDVAECPDLAPILMAVAAECHGARLTGTARLRLKESDRGVVMAEELARLGAKVEVGEREITVHPSELFAPRECLSGHNDHRIVMALSVLLVRYGGEIEGAEAVAKSMPDFFEILETVGVHVNRYDIG